MIEVGSINKRCVYVLYS